jgi:hypothetical protein
VQGGTPIYSLGAAGWPNAREFVAADSAAPPDRQEND